MPSAGQGALGKEFKKNQTLPSAGKRALGKEFFFKKNKKSLPSACRVGTRQSDRQWDRRHDGFFSLSSVLGALGKAFAECPIKDTRQRGFCRSIFLLCVLCRVPHSAKALPSAIWPLPSASGTQQKT